mmetsp:Transcript_81361/g.143591  ORF Transcript_81361/g.143591 Transcript_81361/m.143591 type:complete len:236 (+) Transcript_81361:67-774(+)
MVIVSDMDERKPPGGSSFGGHYKKTAFATYVFPRGKQLDRDGTQRLDHQEQREVAQLVDPQVCQSAAIHFTYSDAFQQKNRLAKAVSEKRGTTMKKIGGSASSPALGASMEEAMEVEEEDLPEQEEGPSQEPVSVGEMTEFQASLAMNARWYPHPSLGRGTLKLTGPAALAFGVDPLKDTGHQCPFYEGKKHRFKDVQSLPEARPRTPPKSLRWKYDEHWNDPANHASLKITHYR